MEKEIELLPRTSGKSTTITTTTHAPHCKIRPSTRLPYTTLIQNPFCVRLVFFVSMVLSRTGRFPFLLKIERPFESGEDFGVGSEPLRGCWERCLSGVTLRLLFDEGICPPLETLLRLRGAIEFRPMVTVSLSSEITRRSSSKLLKPKSMGC